MRILAVRTHYKTSEGKERLSAVDWWRIQNPLSQLAKNDENISVDFVNKVVDESGNVDMQWENIGDEYDVIYTSYLDSPKGYAYIKAIGHKYGIKHVMDLDDNIFDIDQFNPAYIRYHPGSQDLQNAITILSDVDLLVCSTKTLAETCKPYREGPIVVMENYIDPDVFSEDKIKPSVDKGIHIGYMGSSTHFTDLMQSGAMWALRRLVTEYDDLYIHLVGSMYEEVEKMFEGYRDRLLQVGGARDFNEYIENVWSSFPFDIGIAPLIDSPFNRCKSSQKYYEYALRDIVGVYSYVEPYIHKIIEGETGYFAKDEQEWYWKLKWLIDDKKNTQRMREQAKADVLKRYTIQDHWEEVGGIVRKVV